MTFELGQIKAGYQRTTVLRDVSLIVPRQSVVALLGPNGAGKTTLLRVASGLLRPWSGHVLVDGKDMTGAHPHELAGSGVCHVPEGQGIFRSLSVRENLSLQAIAGSEPEAVERAVEVFPFLGKRLSQSAGTLSGGEQQMLGLARAYITSPVFVLLDEVSMGLAPTIVDEIFEFLVRLVKEGASLLLVEQYVQRALELAEYVYLLKKGEIVFAGETAEVKGSAVFEQYLGMANL